MGFQGSGMHQLHFEGSADFGAALGAFVCARAWFNLFAAAKRTHKKPTKHWLKPCHLGPWVVMSPWRDLRFRRLPWCTMSLAFEQPGREPQAVTS